jgi:hypothetical protein
MDKKTPSKGIKKKAILQDDYLAICQHVAQGGSVKDFCAPNGGMGQNTFYKWVAENPENREIYKHARESWALCQMEKCLEIADNEASDVLESGDGRRAPNSAKVHRDKLRIDTRIKVIEMTSAHKYGPKHAMDAASKAFAGAVAKGFIIKGLTTEQLGAPNEDV